MSVNVNPLVAARVDPDVKPWTGIWLAEDIELLVQGVRSNNWVDTSLGAIGATLDGLAFYSDPASTLLQYGLSWLMEQVAPLREALDWLAGNAAQIAAHAATWRRVAADLRTTSTTLGDHIAVDVADWGGTAGPAYRAWSSEQRGALSALAQAAEAMAVITECAGFVVSAVRAMVRDAIAIVVSRCIVYAVEEVATLGLATPLVIEQVSTLVAACSAKIAKWLRGLIQSLENLFPALRHLSTLIAKIKEILRPMRSPGDPFVPPEKGSPEWIARHNELAKDPAKGGAVEPKSEREAEVALALEASGTLPGPLRRAVLDTSDPARHVDLGDFIDSTGQHWDVKAPTDIFPSGRHAGEVMPPTLRGRYIGEEFEGSMVKEIAKGQNVILDTGQLSPESKRDLLSRIARHPEWNGRVVTYP